MSIKNRLKQLQSRIIKEDSKFCDCATEIRTVVLIPTADGGKRTLDGKPYEEPPEFCETCGKQNGDPLHVSFIINPSVELTGEAR